MHIRLLILFFCLPLFLFSQTDIAALQQSLAAATDDSTRVDLAIKIARKFTLTNFDSALHYNRWAANLAQQTNNQVYALLALERVAAIQGMMGNNQQALQLNAATIRMAKNWEQKSSLARLFNIQAEMFIQTLQYDSSLHYTLLAEELLREKEEYAGLVNCMVRKASIYKSQDQEEKIETALLEARALADQYQLRIQQSIVYIELIKLYHDLKEEQKYSRIVEDYHRIQNENPNYLKHISNSNFYLDYIETNDSENRKELIRNNVRIHQEQGNVVSYAFAVSQLAQYEISKGKLSTADALLKHAFVFTDSLRLAFPQLRILREWKELKYQLGAYRDAYDVQAYQQQLLDSLSNIQVQTNLNELETRYQTAEKEIALAKQAEELLEQKQARRNLIFVIVSLVVLALAIAYFLFYRIKNNRLLAAKNIEIQKALDEKEILLKEIHHRVKNNLQVISGLLKWQSQYIHDGTALDAIQEGQNRVQSMALIHQKLYQSDNLTGIEMKDYIDRLSNSLFNSYNINNEKVQLKTDVTSILLDIDTVIPIGLILNELLSNALKHAFPEQRKGEITVALQQDADELLLSVIDNGVGMQKGAEKKQSFGWELIETLAKKLKAQLLIDHSQGTKILLKIKNFKLAPHV